MLSTDTLTSAWSLLLAPVPVAATTNGPRLTQRAEASVPQICRAAVQHQGAERRLSLRTFLPLAASGAPGSPWQVATSPRGSVSMVTWPLPSVSHLPLPWLMRTPGIGLGPTWITHGGPRSLHLKTLHHTRRHLFPNKIRSTGSRDSRWTSSGCQFLASHPPSLQPSKYDTSFHLLPHGQELGTSLPAGSLGPQAGRCSRPSATLLHHEALDFSSKVFTNLEDTRESSKTHNTEEEGKKRPRLQWTLPPPPEGPYHRPGPKGQST